jgi:hypothetical protein
MPHAFAATEATALRAEIYFKSNYPCKGFAVVRVLELSRIRTSSANGWWPRYHY